MNHQNSRRAFLADIGMGFTGLAAGAMLFRDGVSRSLASTESGVTDAGSLGLPHHLPRAKRVIWLFMSGGTSHMESFDPKPALSKYAGKEIKETPFASALESPLTKENVRIVVPNDANGHIWHKLYPLQVGFKKRGHSGIEVSDWWPHVGSVIDEIAVVRSMWTTDNNHGAQLQFHTGRHRLDGFYPTIGAWTHYGLGAINENLPSFVVLGTPIADCCGGNEGHGGDYLGPEHNGIRLNVDPKNPLPFASPPVASGVTPDEQKSKFDLLNKLNKLGGIEYPDDPALTARIKSYELAYRMQTAVPETMRFSEESDATQELYGLNEKPTQDFGRLCLAARRLVERGVRFVQVFHGSNGGAGAWDSHAKLKDNHSKLCGQVDKPIAGLIKDLKQRGMLDDTLVVWGTEFGRTPGAQNSDGRDHHPYGFSIWLAGGGVKGGIVHGATDELGFHAVENRHYITDLHATVLHQLGLDSRRLNVPGRKRLEIDYGQVIKGILT
ncbi:MAG: DUF1501 domain-containing protein [Phycisphaeraceae bacterium]